MIGIPGNVRVYLVCGVTDMRKGFDGLAARVQTTLRLDPHGGALFVFRGRRGDLIKVLWWDGQGLCLFAKRLERGRFLWPRAKDGSVVLTAAQLSMLLEGIDWRRHAAVGPFPRWPAMHPADRRGDSDSGRVRCRYRSMNAGVNSWLMPDATDPIQEIAELRALLAAREAELAEARAELTGARLRDRTVAKVQLPSCAACNSGASRRSSIPRSSSSSRC